MLSLLLAAAIASAAARDLARGQSAVGVKVDEVVSDLGGVTDFAFLPDGRLVIIEKEGTVRVRRADRSVVEAARLPVDDASEKGGLGVAVDPDFKRTQRIFLYYSAADSVGGTDLDRHRVVSILLKPDGRLDRASERVLVHGLRGPRNHDGGGLAVGRDGKLYIGVGDTGCNSNRPPEPPYQPSNTFATCLSNANGKILRINLDGSIPTDNPLFDVLAVTACGTSCRDGVSTKTAPPRKEIWAWGFRNPWRLWPDPKTGRVWVGDVGEITYEEITIADKGRHYGWPWREGASGWPRSRCQQISPNAGPCVDPVYFCGREAGSIDGDCRSITGGEIVDGCHWPDEQRGRYVFGDNVTGYVWSLKVNADRGGVDRRSRRELYRLPKGVPVTIHVGPDGDVYVASFPGDVGRILRIAPEKARRCEK
ncbi:MAG TPA: PQQ-dependent sugar dehydrogenase [Polyangia bacterium]|jgi:glucose/arabinose dehydrogenase|nr:PQQ-dependent sugar dehydrogenase [Polyangia bacterium]